MILYENGRWHVHIYWAKERDESEMGTKIDNNIVKGINRW